MTRNFDINEKETGDEGEIDSIKDELKDESNTNRTFKVNNSDPGDPCYSYEYSIVFCFIMVVAIVMWCTLAVLLILKKKTNLTGMDRIYLLLGICSIVQFGPLLAAALHAGHNFHNYSQTGCKMMFYTEYGTRHTVTFLVLSLYTYAHVGLRHGFESIDRKIRENFGWFIVLLAAVECLFGMGPAIYVDIFPIKRHPLANRCIWSPTIDVSHDETKAMEVVERAWTPYLLPCLGLVITEVLLCLQSASLIQLSANIVDRVRKSNLITILICVATYFAQNLPYAFLLVGEFYAVIKAKNYDMDQKTVICNFKWVFILIHQFWFLVTPSVFLFKELDLFKTVFEQLPNLTWQSYRSSRVRVVSHGKPGDQQPQQQPHTEYTNNLAARK